MIVVLDLSFYILHHILSYYFKFLISSYFTIYLIFLLLILIHFNWNAF